MPTRRIFVRADVLSADLSAIPERSGVYLFYLAGGSRVLERTGYFNTDYRAPQEHEGRQHLYTGAATNLRLRMKQHFERDWRGSTFRKSLLAVEFKRQAISKSRTECSNVRDEISLTNWLQTNTILEFQLTERPFEREHSIINRYASPFNITWRRQHAYSRMLMKWRNAVFPPWRPPHH